ncbi:hypothetical protein ARMGADRAFT_1004595, partial [Armillaria gallica]
TSLKIPAQGSTSHPSPLHIYSTPRSLLPNFGPSSRSLYAGQRYSRSSDSIILPFVVLSAKKTLSPTR